MTINQGNNFFYSSSKPLQGEELSWSDESFLLTLNSGYETLRIQLHQHASETTATKEPLAKQRPTPEATGSDSIIDSLELRLEEVLLELTDQETHSLVRLGTKKNTFQVALRWTFEENMRQVQQLKKQLAVLVERKHKEEEAYRAAKRRSDNLQNKRGLDLLEEWGGNYIPDLKKAIAKAQGRRSDLRETDKLSATEVKKSGHATARSRLEPASAEGALHGMMNKTSGGAKSRNTFNMSAAQTEQERENSGIEMKLPLPSGPPSIQRKGYEGFGFRDPAPLSARNGGLTR